MYPDLTRQFIHRYTPDKGIEYIEDVMIVEANFNVYVNYQFYETMLCTPSNIEELVVGHLAIKKTIHSYEDITKLAIEGQNIYITTAYNPVSPENDCPKDFEESLYPEDINYLMRKHLNSSELHKLTGGVHLMGLATREKIIITREDIGRHNAVDKIYGYCLKNNMECHDKIFLSSGRVTHEIIQKLLQIGVKVVVSRAAVTNLAKAVADQAGITVIGFARGERFNIYSHPNRIFSK